MKRLAALIIVLSSALLCGPGASGQKAPQTPHHGFDVTARRYAFDPPVLEVHEGDLVKVTLHTADIPHSFVVDVYRLARKASIARSVRFEFLADRPGEFTFYCNLTIEDGCRDMKGRLHVLPEPGSP